MCIARFGSVADRQVVHWTRFQLEFEGVGHETDSSRMRLHWSGLIRTGAELFFAGVGTTHYRAPGRRSRHLGYAYRRYGCRSPRLPARHGREVQRYRLLLEIRRLEIPDH